MTLSIKHKFQSAKTDGADASLVQPSNWNDGHDLTGSNNILFGTNGSGTGGEITVSTGLSLSSSTLTVAIGSAVQGWDADLDAIAALSGTSGLLKKTAANTWTLDTTTYLATTTVGSTVQGWDADLDAIAALSGTSGLLKKTNTNTWTLDTTTYQSQITASGLLKGAGSGSVSAASAGTDYLVPPSGTSLLKANSGGALANATAGTDYLAPPTGTALLKANSGGALANATAGTDYLAPPSGTAILKANSGGALANATAGTDYVSPGGSAGAITATGLKETKTAPSISSGTLSIDCSAGNVFAVSLNANITTLSFSNVPSTGTAYGLTLALTADGTARTITWGSSVKWPGGTAPTLTSTSGKVDVFVLNTWDGGTTWYAFVGGQSL